jgi:hypothetical protein
METVDRVIKELGAGLTTREAAIRAVHPGYSDDEVAATLAEGEEEDTPMESGAVRPEGV